MDRAQLADFLRTRREALAPEDVGLPRGPRRRAPGLRREEVAALAQMSVDYYSRLEQSRGPQPSEQMLAAISRGLRLSLDERDHLFRLAGHGTPSRMVRLDHISPGLMRVLDRLEDTPAQLMNVLGETLVQTPAAVALLGDQSHFQGLERNATYRFFLDEAERSRCSIAATSSRAFGRLTRWGVITTRSASSIPRSGSSTCIASICTIRRRCRTSWYSRRCQARPMRRN